MSDEAEKIYWQHHDGVTYFERAIFLSWYCSVGDCKFCYMSTQKDKITEPKLAKRQVYSLYAEAILCKALKWPVGFLSGGYGVYEFDELKKIIKTIYDITGQKQWLNVGVLSKKHIKEVLPYIEGVTGSVETVDKTLHDEVCPSKPLEPVIAMYNAAKELQVKRGMTIIIGLGEDKTHLEKVKEFIKEHEIEKIVVYALNPIKGTVFTKGPEPEYFLWWLSQLRIAFPKLHIVAGTWVERLRYLRDILATGPTSITKLPAWRVFGSKYADIMNEEMAKAKRRFPSYFKNAPEFDYEEEIQKLPLDENEKLLVRKNLENYLSKIKK